MTGNQSRPWLLNWREGDIMPTATLETIEGRLNALRALLVTLARDLPKMRRDTLLRELASLTDHQNHQEDPGAVVNVAFAIGVARTRELEALIREIEVQMD